MGKNKLHFVRLNPALAAAVFLFFAAALVLAPRSASAAASGLVPCGTQTDSSGAITNPCGFNDLITLVTNITNYLIIIGASIAALVFCYVGWLYMTAGGSPEAHNKAKGIFGKVVIGFVVMLAAWLVVHAVYCSIVVQDKGFLSYVGVCSPPQSASGPLPPPASASNVSTSGW